MRRRTTLREPGAAPRPPARPAPGRGPRARPALALGARPALAAILVALLWLAAAGCGGDDGAAGAADAPARHPDYSRALADAPPALEALYDQGGELLAGGEERFEATLQRLRGHPVVVNAWASWCVPCREEFPYLQSQVARHGAEVAFLGVLAEDSEDAARTFLERFPVPYPSVVDPDRSLTDSLAGVGLPVTAYFSADGERLYTHSGQYRSEAELAADIERYALGGPGGGSAAGGARGPRAHAGATGGG